MPEANDDYRRNAAFCRQQAERTKFPELKADWLRLSKLWLTLMPRRNQDDRVGNGAEVE